MDSRQIHEERCRYLHVPTVRYRPNVVFEGASLPFAEDMWRKMTISSPTPHGLSNVRSFTLVSKCTRCLVNFYLLLSLR